MQGRAMPHYLVEVSGDFLNPTTGEELPRTGRFRVIAPTQLAAEMAAAQRFRAAGSAERLALMRPPTAVCEEVAT